MTKLKQPTLFFSTYMVFYFVHKNQIGIGLPGFARLIFMIAGHDAWISIILAGLFTHIVMFIMIKTLKIYRNPIDLCEIHTDVFGKYFGNGLNVLYALYALILFVTVIRNYIEMVQSWMFHDMPVFILAASILLIVMYASYGGIRVIGGMCFLAFWFSIWMTFIFFFPLRYMHWSSLQPVMETDILHLLKGTQKMTLTSVGFEILYFIYPFVENKKKVGFFAHLGLFVSTCLYLITMIVATGYYDSHELPHLIWSTFNMFKIVQLPFLERFEYVGVSLWMLVILPNLMMYGWIASRTVKQAFGLKMKYSLILFPCLSLVPMILLKTREQINSFSDLASSISFYVAFVYPFVLYLAVLLKKNISKKGSETS